MKANVKSKKKNNEKKVLIGGIGLAAVFIAGATFAWLSSSDEVTNHLTADANYSVSIGEDFTPPTDWTPGQEVTKKVYAVNTGNIDALVRLNLENIFDVTSYGTSVDLPATVNANKIANGATITKAEAKARQAGGYELVSADSDVTRKIDSGRDPDTASNGLHVFLRKRGDNQGVEYEYTGYYKIGSGIDTTYYDVDIRGIKDGVGYREAKIKTKADKKETVTNLSFVTAANSSGTETSFANATAIKIIYHPNTTPVSTDKDIVIYAELDSNAQKNYTFIDNEKPYYFYYNKILKPNTQTEPLITKITLDKDTKDDTFINLIYDLNVKLDSIQVSKDNSGKYTSDTAETWRPAVVNENGTVIW